MSNGASAGAAIARAFSSAEARAGNGKSSSYAEYRSKAAAAGGELRFLSNRDDVFWKFLTARPTGIPQEWDQLGSSAYLFDDAEQRVLSKATGAAGGFLVPQDFDDMITSARRARNVIAAVSREIVTDHGRAIPLPAATAHGTASWTAESAAVSPSDETFAQTTLNAYKATAKAILSEELGQDALDDFDRFLADELGQRAALLEENAFAVGDGSGKPLGVTNSTNGVATVSAGTGSTTTFTLADFKSVFAALPTAYQANAVWIMSTSAFLNAAAATDSAGAPRIPSLHGNPPTLFSRPVAISPELPAAAANARSVVVGDFSVGYAVRRQRRLGVQKQQELHSDSGQVGYRLLSRTDGRVVIADALRILVHSAT